MTTPPSTMKNATGTAFLTGCDELMETRAEIREVAGKVACCEAALEGRGFYLGIKDPAVLLDQLKTLQRKEEQLRETHLIYLRACALHPSPSLDPPVTSRLGPPSTPSVAAPPPSTATPVSHQGHCSVDASPCQPVFNKAARGFVSADVAAVQGVTNRTSFSLHEALGISSSASSSGEAVADGSSEDTSKQRQQQSSSWLGRHALYRRGDRTNGEAPPRSSSGLARPSSRARGAGIGSADNVRVATTQTGARAGGATKDKESGIVEATALCAVTAQKASCTIREQVQDHGRESPFMGRSLQEVFCTSSTNSSAQMGVCSAKEVKTEPGDQRLSAGESDKSSDVFASDIAVEDARSASQNGAVSIAPPVHSCAAPDVESDVTDTDEDIPNGNTDVVHNAITAVDIPLNTAEYATAETAVPLSGIAGSTRSVSGAVDAITSLTSASSRPLRKRRKSAESGWQSRYNADEFISGDACKTDPDNVLIKHEDEDVIGAKPGGQAVKDEARRDEGWSQNVEIGGVEDLINRRPFSADGVSTSGSAALESKRYPRKRDPPNAWKKRCVEGNCQLAASFGPPGKNALYCSAHKEPGMVNVTHRRCEQPGCMHQPSFNMEGEKKALFCRAHKDEGMVNVCSPRCAHDGCVVRPSFGFLQDRKAIFCDAHKMVGMTNVRKKRRELKVSQPQEPRSPEVERTAYVVESQGATNLRRSFLADFRVPERGLSPITVGPAVSGFGDGAGSTHAHDEATGERGTGGPGAGAASFLEAVSLAAGVDIRQ